MMALGSSSYGNRSTSTAQSNLSASAPPFTVDKSFYKSNFDTLLNYSGLPYGYPQIQANPSSEPRYDDAEFVGTGSVQSNLLYGFSDSQFSDSMSAPYVPLNQAYEPPMYDQYLGGMESSSIEAEPYYSPYVSASKDCVSVGNNEHKYELLSDSVTTQVSGLSQVNCSQIVPPLETPVEYSHPWTGFVNGVDDGKQASGNTFFSNDYELSGSRSYMKQGKHNPFEGSKTAPLASASNHQGNPRIGELFPVSSNVWATDPYSETFEKPADSSGPFASAVKSPSVVIRSPLSGKSSLDRSTVAFNNIIHASNKDANRSKPFVEYDLFSFGPLHFPLDFKDQYLGNEGASHAVYGASSSTKWSDSLGTKIDNKGDAYHTIMEISVPLLPSSNNHDFLELKLEGADASGPVEKSSDVIDIHTPVVDSPCWKGAPSSRFSPFESFDLAEPELLSKNLDACNNLDNQSFHNKDLNTTDAVSVCEKVNESSSCETFLVMESSLPQHGDCGPKKQKLYCSETKDDTEAVQAVQFDVDTKNSEKEIQDKAETDGDSKVSFITVEGTEKEGQCASEGKLEPLVVDTPGKSPENANATSTEGLSVFPSNLADSLFGKPLGDLNRTVGFRFLVNTMKNLSEMLSSHCPDDPLAVAEQDCSTLREIITNISAFLPPERLLVNTMKNLSGMLSSHCPDDPLAVAEQDRSTLREIITNISAFLPQEMAAPCTQSGEVTHQDGTPSVGDLPDLSVSASSDRAGSCKVSSANLVDVDSLNILNAKGLSALRSGRNESNNHTEAISLKSMTDDASNVDMTQAIKRVLYENFPVEEELDGQALFYKNLWLEAEAALCCSTVNTRFCRMKKEMANHVHSPKVGEIKDEPSHPVSPGVNGVGEHGCKAKDDRSNTTTTCHSVEVDTSVMDWFQVLSSRVEKSKAADADVQDPTAYTVSECEASKVQEITECNVGSSGLMNSEDQRPLLRGLKDILNFKGPSQVVLETCNPDPIMEGDTEASVLARFNILKNRINRLDSNSENPQSPVLGQEHGINNFRNVLEDRIQVQLSTFGESRKFPWNDKVLMGPTIDHAQSCAVDGTDDPRPFQFLANSRSSNQEDVKTVNKSFMALSSQGSDLFPLAKLHSNPLPSASAFVGANKRTLGNGVLEGWYDCPASEWEHVSKEDFLWQK